MTLPPMANEGAALVLVLEKLGLPASAMMALGDGLNDLGMLRLAGTSVAMQNAVPLHTGRRVIFLQAALLYMDHPAWKRAQLLQGSYYSPWLGAAGEGGSHAR